MAEKQEFHKGDKVSWSSGSGEAAGTVQKRITSEQTVDGQTVAASESDPRYLVKNENTGSVTGHRVETLSKAGSGGDKFQPGDKVQWETAQGTTTGTVKKKLTSETDIKGYTAKASEEDPQYLVESDSTGEAAAHKPDALERC